MNSLKNTPQYDDFVSHMHMKGSVFEQNEFVYVDFIYVDVFIDVDVFIQQDLSMRIN